jgi:hypothetical protein
LKFKVAVRVPLALGAKVIFAVQLAFAARLDPQVFEKILKSAALVPVMVMLLIVIVLLLLFVSVTTFCPPIPPTATDAQLTLVGETVAATAVPERAMHKLARAASRERRPGRNCVWKKAVQKLVILAPEFDPADQLKTQEMEVRQLIRLRTPTGAHEDQT